MTLLRRAFSRAVEAVYPAHCFGCRETGRFLCDACLAAETPSQPHAHPRLFENARSAYVYGGIVRTAVLALKFEGVSAAAPEIAAPMAAALRDWSPPVDVIVPVPLGWLRKRTRGYNQSELLAVEIGRAAGLPVETRAVRRRRQTSPQAQQPDAEARLRNIREAFAPGPRPLSGAVLLVDDVTTTGATLDACARALRAGGATSVHALTFARES